METISSTCCPITGKNGRALRLRTPEQLREALQQYSRMPLSDDLAAKYLTQPVTEYYSVESGLRWYSPCRLGEADLYEHLATFPKYYNPGCWDKITSVDLLKKIGAET